MDPLKPRWTPNQMLLQQQLEQARALQQPSGRAWGAGAGGVLGTLGDVLRTGLGAYQEKQIGNQLTDDATKQQVQAEALAGRMKAPDSPETLEARSRAVAIYGNRLPPGAIDTLTAANQKEWFDAAERSMGYKVQEDSAAANRELSLTINASNNDAAALRQKEQLAYNRGRDARDNTIREKEIAARAAQQLGQLESSLREELIKQPAVKDYLSASIEFEKMSNAAALGTAPGDVALVYSFMKSMDPASTVREGEFASASNAAGVPERIRNLFNRAMSGELLSPEQRAEFLRTARSQIEPRKALYDKTLSQYTGLAKAQGADPSRVVLPPGGGSSSSTIDLSAPPAPTQGDKVKVRTSDGQEGMIPRANLQKLMARDPGAKVVE